MHRGVFVTGTDTGVGKTVVAAALLLRYRDTLPLRYWKPVQTGIECDDDTGTIRRLTRCGPERVLDEGVRLEGPVSPHLAARLAGCAIDVGPFVHMLRAQPGTYWIVEGAGGVLVPLSESSTMADLIRALQLPVVVVARSTLGTINHTLLTLEALRARRLAIAGVVMVGPPDSENRSAIERYGEVAVLGELPLLEPLDNETLTRWVPALDPEGRLAEAIV